MKPDLWERWLLGWLERHPLKDPPLELRREYIRQVMERVRTPAPILVFRPRPAFALAGALATALAVVLAVRAPGQAARRIEQEAQVLFEAGGVSFLSDADLEQELQDLIPLAEAGSLR